ncbi:MAG TPA: tetratricopeptide repeat protein [Polyangiaceae bacterium]
MCLTFVAQVRAAEPAQPEASPFRTAQLLYEQAETLRKRGDVAESCALYRLSFDAYQSYLALCGIARCLEVEGRFVDALVAYERARALADMKDDIAFADVRIAALESRIAYLAMNVSPENVTAPKIELWRNGKSNATARVHETQRLDPGEYEVRASAANGDIERTVITLHPGEHKSLNLKFTLRRSPTTQVNIESAHPRANGIKHASPLYLYSGATLAGLGVISISYGITRGTAAWSKRDELSREGIDDASYNALVRQARDARSDAAIFILGGSVAGLAGIASVLYYYGGWPFHAADAQHGATLGTLRVSTAVGPGGISLKGTF